ncbi:hypothetical protein [Saccharopolyspora taberi]|uniref:Uncharacterized protein n=1 Tax=Saccharopolyspora taberi TaxID=60895 RepID=A0ABN3V2D5_9PSEU
MRPCTCLCNQAGHVDRCQGSPEQGLRLPEGWPVLMPSRETCRACYQAAVRATARRS